MPARRATITPGEKEGIRQTGKKKQGPSATELTEQLLRVFLLAVLSYNRNPTDKLFCFFAFCFSVAHIVAHCLHHTTLLLCLLYCAWLRLWSPARLTGGARGSRESTRRAELAAPPAS